MRRAGDAFVLRARRRSACAFRRLARIRPTGAPCSTQVRLYDAREPGARPARGKVPQFAKSPVFHISTAPPRPVGKCPARTAEIGQLDITRVIVQTDFQAGPFALPVARATLMRAVGGSKASRGALGACGGDRR